MEANRLLMSEDELCILNSDGFESSGAAGPTVPTQGEPVKFEDLKELECEMYMLAQAKRFARLADEDAVTKRRRIHKKIIANTTLCDDSQRSYYFVREPGL